MEAKYFERGKCLGEGAFGKVFLCFHKKEPGKRYMEQASKTNLLERISGRMKYLHLILFYTLIL